MVVKKHSISVSAELSEAIQRLAVDLGEDVSPLIETLLREHAVVASVIQKAREQRLGLTPGPRALGLA